MRSVFVHSTCVCINIEMSIIVAHLLESETYDELYNVCCLIYMDIVVVIVSRARASDPLPTSDNHHHHHH